MEGNSTFLYNLENQEEEPKRFTFDYSYWSHDGFTEADNGLCIPDANQPNGDIYADQVGINQTLFDIIGQLGSYHEIILFFFQFDCLLLLQYFDIAFIFASKVYQSMKNVLNK